MTDILKEICEVKRELVAQRKKQVSEQSLLESAKTKPKRGFINAIKQKIDNDKTALIAEIKKASPSKGLIRADFSPSLIAKSYERAGASCISVLTDEPYFMGRDEYVEEVKAACSLPVLRKDFIVDTYQVAETAAIGADCMLLIMAALDDMQAKDIEDAAISFGLDVLIEIHDEAELERALKLKSNLIGINNRNLKTLVIDLVNTERLAPMIPDDYVKVCESGIYSHNDIMRMKQVPVNCFLVGESLMISDNIEQATKNLLGM